MLKKIKKSLNDKVETLFGADAESVLVEKGRAVGIGLKNGDKIYSDYVILAPGRKVQGGLKRIKASSSYPASEPC